MYDGGFTAPLPVPPGMDYVIRVCAMPVNFYKDQQSLQNLQKSLSRSLSASLQQAGALQPDADSNGEPKAGQTNSVAQQQPSRLSKVTAADQDQQQEDGSSNATPAEGDAPVTVAEQLGLAVAEELEAGAGAPPMDQLGEAGSAMRPPSADDVDIAPDLFGELKYSGVEWSQFAIQPPEEDVMHYMYDKGVADAKAWAQSIGWTGSAAADKEVDESAQ